MKVKGFGTVSRAEIDKFQKETGFVREPMKKSC